MVTRKVALACLRVSMALALNGSLTATAFAQAWVPQKGAGAVSFQYQNALVTDHFFGSTRLDVGHIQTHDVVIDAAYGLTDHLAVRFTVPFVASKYDGAFPHTVPELPNYDNNHYHGTWQDLRFDARYALSPGRSVVVTPFVNVIIPSHDYFYFAHSAPGTDLHELQTGAYVARMLDPIVPRAFVQVRLAYGFVERVLGISHNRSYADLEVGYFVSPGFRVFVTGTGLLTHGGIRFPSRNTRAALLNLGAAMGVGDAVWVDHDQIGREQSANLGLGGSIAVTKSLDLFGTLGTNLAERNGHAIKRAFAVGVTWHFSPDDPLGDLRGRAKGAIARCACDRGR
jgi:hypothetical protein